MPKDAKTIQAELSRPFAPEDLEWRIQQAFEEKGRGLAVPYVTNRAIQDRLDDVVGPENWHNEFKPWHGNGKKEAQICGISIYFEGRGVVTKWDGAEDTDIEPVKGGLSDSMKRAAVQWGIGRVLYKMDVVWVNIEKRGRSWIIPDSEHEKLNRAYLELLKKLHLDCAKPGGLHAELPSCESTQQQRKDTKVTQLPVPPEPACEYTVMKMTVQPGINRSATTVLTLRGQDGKMLRAFARGEHPDLTPGTELTHVTLNTRQQSSVVFYVLESYEVIGDGSRAA